MRRLLSLWIILSTLGFPSAADDLKFVAVDLQPHATQKRFEALGSGIDGNDLAIVPAGGETFGGIVFNIEDGIVHLGSTIVDRHPEKVAGISVGSKCLKLYILHATCFGGGPNKPGNQLHVPDGTLIGQYVIHYSDGSTEDIPIVYGEDVRDWFYVDDEAKTTRGKIVWNGENQRATEVGAKIRLYMMSWENPHPEKTIKSMDYVGKKSETPAAPFCLAITLER